jgi:hypothetical protein
MLQNPTKNKLFGNTEQAGLNGLAIGKCPVRTQTVTQAILRLVMIFPSPSKPMFGKCHKLTSILFPFQFSVSS